MGKVIELPTTITAAYKAYQENRTEKNAQRAQAVVERYICNALGMKKVPSETSAVVRSLIAHPSTNAETIEARIKKAIG